jgi:hypothetical protein
MKEQNSDMSKWGHHTEGPIQIAKLFCTSLGVSARGINDFDALDAEALFNILKHMKVFHGKLPNGKNSNMTAVAADALSARHTCKHASNPALTEKKVILYKLFSIL